MWANLTQKQAEEFMQRIRPMFHFLHLCRKRLDARGFNPQSTLYAAVAKAFDSQQGLFVELHYLSVERGVGKPHGEAKEEDNMDR
jgi:hypothetical protein